MRMWKNGTVIYTDRGGAHVSHVTKLERRRTISKGVARGRACERRSTVNVL